MSLFSLSVRPGGPRRGLAATAAGSLLGALTLVAVPLSLSPADAAPAKDRPAPVLGTERASAIDGRYVVVLEGRASRAQGADAADLARDRGATDVDRFTSAIEGFSARLPDRALEALRNNPHVAYIEADQRVSIDATQSPATWGLDRIDQRNLPLNNSYTYTPTGQGVTAYVIDTGVLAGHNEFGGRVAAGYTAINDGRGTSDCNGHGTHVAGTVGGSAARRTASPSRSPSGRSGCSTAPATVPPRASSPASTG
jgi:subtilisin family serine protease